MNNSSVSSPFFPQYKGAHVKPGFAEHFYSNPARYKGRDNMFVSVIITYFKKTNKSSTLMLRSFIWPVLFSYFFLFPSPSTMTPLKMLLEGVRSLTLTAWYLSTLVFTQTNGSTSSRLSQWSGLVSAFVVMVTVSVHPCLVWSLIKPVWSFCSSWKSSRESYHWEYQRLYVCIHGRLRRCLCWIHDH